MLGVYAFVPWLSVLDASKIGGGQWRNSKPPLSRLMSSERYASMLPYLLTPARWSTAYAVSSPVTLERDKRRLSETICLKKPFETQEPTASTFPFVSTLSTLSILSLRAALSASSFFSTQ